MDIETAKFLTGSKGLELLETAKNISGGSFRLAKFLREETSPKLASALSTTLELRRKAEQKFSRAAAMLFTRSALEQASAEAISTYRCGRFTQSGIRRLADLCCSIAGDSISFAQQLEVIGIDLDPARLILAAHNIRVYQAAANFRTMQEDITRLDLSRLGIEAFFIDPARRTEEGTRLFHPESWSPKLSEITEIITRIPNAAVKCAPGIAHESIPQEAEAEFISYAGELRECLLWFGDLKCGIKRQATLLPGGHQLCGSNPRLEVTAIREYIYEPDSAVIRAGLVEFLGSQIGATKISESICFLTADNFVPTPFARGFRVISIFPYRPKELKKQLKEFNCGSANIIKRGVGTDIPTLLKQLKLKGKRHLDLILTRSFEEKVCLVVEPM